MVGAVATRKVSERLPDFPWDHLTAYGDTARAHPDGIVDLSVGTPVDPTPAVVQAALAEAADSPGYPLTVGRVDTRQACLDWLERRFGVTGLGLDAVLPTPVIAKRRSSQSTTARRSDSGPRTVG